MRVNRLAELPSLPKPVSRCRASGGTGGRFTWTKWFSGLCGLLVAAALSLVIVLATSGEPKASAVESGHAFGWPMPALVSSATSTLRSLRPIEAASGSTAWFERWTQGFMDRVRGNGKSPNANPYVGAAGSAQADGQEVTLKGTIATGLGDYMELSPVEVMIGLERTARVLACCDTIRNEPGVEVAFLSRAAAALTEVEWRPDWRDRILRMLALVEARRGNIKVATSYMSNIRNPTEKGMAAYVVAREAYGFGQIDTFNEMTSAWLAASESLPAEQRNWIRIGVAVLNVRVGRLEEGQALAEQLFRGRETLQPAQVQKYHEAVAKELVFRGRPEAALAELAKAGPVNASVVMDSLVRHLDAGELAPVLMAEFTRTAASLSPDPQLLFALSETLTRIGRIDGVLAVHGRRQMVRDTVVLGAVSGLLKSGQWEAARQLGVTEIGSKFDTLFDAPNLWLQTQAVGTYANVHLTAFEQTGDRRELETRLARLDAKYLPPAARLSLFSEYSRHNETERVAALFDSVPELAALKIETASGRFSEAVAAVLAKPRGLKRGVMLLQLAEVEARRRQSLAPPEDPRSVGGPVWAP